MADAAQIRKVCAIIRADEARKIIVVSAAGKRSRDDHKITDLLYLCYAHIKYGVSCMDVFEQVKQRYLDIRDELGLNTPLEAEFDALWERMQHGIGEDELVSRGEYFSARLLADALGYDFIDAKLWLTFALDGSIDEEASYSALRRIAADAYSRLRAAAATLRARWRRRRLTRTYTKTGLMFRAYLWRIRA